MPSTNAQLAHLFQQTADAMELTGQSRFRIIANQKAARVIGELIDDVAGLSRAQLTALEGIGTGTAARIAEFLDTGQIKEHQHLLAQIPAGLFQILAVPGLGPKTVAVLWHEAGVTDPASLQTAIDDGRLESLKGFGKKKIENIAKNMAFLQTASQRTRLGEALPLAEALADVLGSRPDVTRCQIAGSLRRGKETIGDIDLLVGADAGDAPAIMNFFTGLDIVADVIAHGDTKASIRTTEALGGIQVDLRVIAPRHLGAAMMYFTGSKAHNVKLRERALSRGYTLNEYALAQKDDKSRVVAADTEEAIYAKLGLAWIPPELREDRGEIAMAQDHALPELVELADIRAELHAHTTASDGRWSIQELATAAAQRGFHTIAITDHSKGQAQANGLSDQRLEAHIRAIHAVRDKLRDTIHVLAGSEVDIHADGTLDYPDTLLAELDIVVASPHAALSQDPDLATTRFLRAIENPHVTILGHVTGRLIGRRPGLSPDMTALFKAAAARGVAMEINANAWRLDLRDTHARAALEHGVKLAINTDAHGPADLDQLRYGVLTARRAGATKNDVLNCMGADDLAAWLKR